MKAKIYLFALAFMSAFGLQAQTIMNIHQSNGTVLQIPLNTIDSITYTIPNPGNLAAITTTAVTSLTGSTAVSGGNVSNDGGTLVTQRGICYSTSPAPTTANTTIMSGSGIGSFTSNLSGLTTNTTYYVRAYAINSAGTAYGNELSFTTTAGNLATISTTTVTSITGSTAFSGGNVSNDGGTLVTQRGICYSTSPSPTTANTTIISGSGIGSFTCNLNGLSSSTTYYVRAYAVNSAGTAYGNEVSFTTAYQIVSNPGAGVTFDGYTYGSIVLGNGQEWMAENLRTSVYANGDPIPNETDPTQWINLTTGGWAHYQNNNLYENPYGKLYNWYTINDSRNVCPTGWHVPTDADWTILTDYLDLGLGGSMYTGYRMKSTSGWISLNGDNESGFSGLPAGQRNSNGSFGGNGTSTRWWSATEYLANPGNAWMRGLQNQNDVVEINIIGLYGWGLSVRCLKD
jgi:uncharacterized protein (TIGR02145 family)